jgi:ATP-binding cassette subfamily B protein
VALAAVIELGIAAVVLALGAGGLWHLAMFGLWIGIAALLVRRYFVRCRRWTDARIAMTCDLVERMVGHRTRLAQERPDLWHDSEDNELAAYVERSRAMDTTAVQSSLLVSRGWMLVGILGLLPAFVGGGASTTGIAVGLGGVLLAYRSLAMLFGGLTQLAHAFVSWRQAAPLFHAAARPDAVAADEVIEAMVDPADEKEGAELLRAHNLSFRYRPHSTPVIEECNLTIRKGEKLLLEGPSGGGKSTLCALLAGLRAPESGLLLHRGLDRQSLGARGWRRLLAQAPQFHENHVFTGTLSYNLLLGRSWPPTMEDIAEAEKLCRDLGLGELLKRMPSGIHQIVGETGWQLSHGEKSRLYIARALLQDAEVVILDESFAALDPDSVHCALTCALDRAKTLLVVAHP